MREGAHKRFETTKATAEHMQEKLKTVGEEVEKALEHTKSMAHKVRCALVLGTRAFCRRRSS